MKRGLATAVLLGFLLDPIAAHAYQSEVDPQDVARDRAARILRRLEIRRELRELRRQEAWLEAEQAALDEITEAVESTPIPAPSGGVAGIIYDVFGSYGAKAVSVASCESGLNPAAVNSSSGAAGLFQLMPLHWEGKFDPFDPVANTRYAYQLSNGGTNWSAWGCA